MQFALVAIWAESDRDYSQTLLSVIIWARSHSAAILKMVSREPQPSRCCLCTSVSRSTWRGKRSDGCSAPMRRTSASRFGSRWRRLGGNRAFQDFKILNDKCSGLVAYFNRCWQIRSKTVCNLGVTYGAEELLSKRLQVLWAKNVRTVLACVSRAHTASNIHFTIYII